MYDIEPTDDIICVRKKTALASFQSFRHITGVTDRQTDRRTDRQTNKSTVLCTLTVLLYSPCLGTIDRLWKRYAWTCRRQLLKPCSHFHNHGGNSYVCATSRDCHTETFPPSPLRVWHVFWMIPIRHSIWVDDWMIFYNHLSYMWLVKYKGRYLHRDWAGMGWMIR